MGELFGGLFGRKKREQKVREEALAVVEEVIAEDWETITEGLPDPSFVTARQFRKEAERLGVPPKDIERILSRGNDGWARVDPDGNVVSWGVFTDRVKEPKITRTSAILVHEAAETYFGKNPRTRVRHHDLAEVVERKFLKRARDKGVPGAGGLIDD